MDGGWGRKWRIEEGGRGVPTDALLPAPESRHRLGAMAAFGRKVSPRRRQGLLAGRGGRDRVEVSGGGSKCGGGRRAGRQRAAPCARWTRRAAGLAPRRPDRWRPLQETGVVCTAGRHA